MANEYIPRKVLAFFAHPDDESFGPGGTITKWAKAGAEIQIVCATKGELGGDGAIRENELREAAKVMGVSYVEFLDHQDGHIDNACLASLEEVFMQRIEIFKPDTLITFNHNGVSGHLDHIAVSSATTQAFRKTTIPQRLYYYALCKSQTSHMKNYFIYFPEGYEKEEIDEIVDISAIWDTRMEAVHKHASQEHDIQNFLKSFETVREEYFLIRTREE